MKRVKALGSLAVVAIFAMALMGPPAAMGESTLLCEADEIPCSSSVSHVHYVAKDMFILTSAGSSYDYKCDVLLLATVGELGSPQELEGKFTYTSCNGGCARTEVSEGGTLFFLRVGTELAEVTGEGFEVLSNCSFFHCVYSLENLTGNAVGPLLSTANNGEIIYAKATLTKVSGFFCPEVTWLDAIFVPLSATYISS